MTEQDFTIQDLQNEIWKTIPSHPNYQVSNLGRIRYISILKQSVSNCGYLRVYLSERKQGGSQRTLTVHGLVANAFLGERTKGMQVNHKDGKKENNTIENLEYVTPSENQRHAIRIGLVGIGENHYSHLKPYLVQRGEQASAAKINENDVREIRKLADEGVPRKEIQKRFSLSKATISKIITRKNWAHVD